ncbi:LysR family transcriptional regulator [Pseudomonas vancouverensis]|uniref:LysR family transcriptional regulator n=1 Tax=Pseudomonas vancouverensis TaxID=95300 RepID=A0A1H2MKH7_PSEVA|nr:LysR family transcriptional regulator [Pseudomonas vancouverensis]KAB0494749.1 LysR family transcriptional regulator [Pseudomonas vancouverensis]TDB59415.1 LysR family transcriptional regulator [Pseudomonas vancouverensis]SDU93710.1 DNA-binding transcriptional regulator, LysR family [Pseudomonas vancouverensis]
MTLCKNARSPFRWDDLRFFLAVAQAGSLLGASKILQVDRTTVARRIDALERSIGKRLFSTDDNVIRTTEAGSAVLKASERVNEQITELEQLLYGTPEGVEGTVKIAVAQGLGDAFIQDILALHETHPRVSIDIVSVANPMELVAERKADLGIGDAYERPERLESALLGNLEIAMYGSTARNGQPPGTWIGWSEYAPKPFIDWVNGHVGEGESISTKVNSWEALQSAVLAGGAAAPLWCMLADANPRLERLAAIEAHYIALWLVSPEGLKRQPAHEATWRFLRNRIAEHVAAADRG